MTLHADGTTGGVLPNRSAIATRLADEPADRAVRAVLRRPRRHRALVRAAGVPGYGWQPVAAADDAVAPCTVDTDALVMVNGLITVRVGRRDGTFAIGDTAGLGRLVDDGDAGDTYNWCPPAHDTVVEGPESVVVHVDERGPLRTRLTLDAVYRWPARVDDGTGRRIGEESTSVRTTLTLHAGQPFLVVAHTIDNRSEDHRVRAWFPLPEPASRSRAECAFTVVERALTAEGGPTETGLPTFPSRRFVQAGGLTLVHEGLLEYELVDVHGGRAQTLALTVLRASRYLSRGPMATRPLPAGPIVELRGSQMPGRHTMRYAVTTATGVDPVAMVDDAFLPLRVVAGSGTGSRASTGQSLAVEGGAVVSSLRRVGGRLEIRAFNPTDHRQALQLPGRTGHVVDLTGRVLAPFDGAAELGPHAIVTIRLDETAGPR